MLNNSSNIFYRKYPKGHRKNPETKVSRYYFGMMSACKDLGIHKNTFILYYTIKHRNTQNLFTSKEILNKIVEAKLHLGQTCANATRLRRRMLDAGFLTINKEGKFNLVAIDKVAFNVLGLDFKKEAHCCLFGDDNIESQIIAIESERVVTSVIYHNFKQKIKSHLPVGIYNMKGVYREYSRVSRNAMLKNKGGDMLLKGVSSTTIYNIIEESKSKAEISLGNLSRKLGYDYYVFKEKLDKCKSNGLIEDVIVGVKNDCSRLETLFETRDYKEVIAKYQEMKNNPRLSKEYYITISSCMSGKYTVCGTYKKLNKPSMITLRNKGKGIYLNVDKCVLY